MDMSKAISGFIIHIRASQYSPTTIEYYTRYLHKLCAFLGDPSLDAITSDNLKKYMISLQDAGLSNSSIQTYWKVMRSFFTWCQDELGLSRPDQYIPAPVVQSRTIVPFTEDEIKRLLACTEKTKVMIPGRKPYFQPRPCYLRDRALILFLLDTGVRVSELSRLNVEDVDMVTGAVEIKPYQAGRKSRPRQVYIANTCRSALWKYLASREPAGPLFTTIEGERMDRNAIRLCLLRLGKLAKVHNVHPHRFRHTFAIQSLRNGIDVFTLQRLLGHASLVMVRHYLNIADADAMEAHTRTSPADRWKL